METVGQTKIEQSFELQTNSVNGEAKSYSPNESDSKMNKLFEEKTNGNNLNDINYLKKKIKFCKKKLEKVFYNIVSMFFRFNELRNEKTNIEKEKEVEEAKGTTDKKLEENLKKVKIEIKDNLKDLVNYYRRRQDESPQCDDMAISSKYKSSRPIQSAIVAFRGSKASNVSGALPTLQGFYKEQLAVIEKYELAKEKKAILLSQLDCIRAEIDRFDENGFEKEVKN